MENRLKKALLMVSIALDDAIVNNLPTERLSALREQILDIIENS